MARLLASVPRLHVQVAVQRQQQPVLSDLMIAEPQEAGEEHTARRAHQMTLPLVVIQPLRVWKQHAAP